REGGARRLRAVATAAIRCAPNRDGLVEAIARAAGVDVDVLTAEEEARLAFSGATALIDPPPAGSIGVVDVGGGSSELAVGTVAEGARWIVSLPVGSGVLADAHLRSDPPAPGELAALREAAARAFGAISPPHTDIAVAVGGSATSLRRLVGPVLDEESIAEALEAFAEAFPKRQLRPVLRDVKRLADVLGERRDPDVHIAEFSKLRGELAEADHPGVDLLLDSLLEEQARGNERLAAALEEARESDLPGRLAALARQELGGEAEPPPEPAPARAPAAEVGT